MKHWKFNLAVVMLILGAFWAGTHLLCLTKGHQMARTTNGISADAESDAESPNGVASEKQLTPLTIEIPDRPIRYMTLTEAISIALEQGIRRRGRESFLVIDDRVNFRGEPHEGFEIFRAFALDPAVFDEDINGALAKLATRFIIDASNTALSITAIVDSFRAIEPN